MLLAAVGFLVYSNNNKAGAHIDPAGCSGTGISIGLSAFRSNGTTAITGADNVRDGELIKYKSTLAPAAGKCAFFGGTWTIITPDGVSHDVTPGGGVPEIGGAGLSSLDSALVSYTVLHADETSSMLSATTALTGGKPHSNATDVGVVSGSTTDTEFVGHAKISITPDGTNEINDTHTFTLHAEIDGGFGGGFVAVPAGTSLTAIKTSGPGTISGSPCLTSGGTGSCDVTDTSATPGVDSVKGVADITINGTTIHVETDGTGGSSGPATKTWVDANIQITPDGTNRVGATHSFTVHVKVNDGSGFVNAPAGTSVTVTKLTGPGTISGSPCLTVGGTGECTVTDTSLTTGVDTVNATTDVVVGGVTLHRTTDGVGANSGPATKTWVNAAIVIAPNATNEVGQPHTFTVTLSKDVGDGAGFVAFSGAHVDFTLTDSNGAVSVLNAGSSTCDDAGPNTDVLGQCKIVFTSNSAGKVTGHASWTGTLGTPSPFTVETDGAAPNSGDAVKTFVDANISITPDGTNPVNAPHTFTVTVMQDDGLTAAQGGDGVTGLTPATVGNVDVTLTDSGGALSVVDGPTSTCDDNQPSGDNLNASGQCTAVFTSATTGQTVGNASVTLTVGGVSLTRDTDAATASIGAGPGGSGPATKTWFKTGITTQQQPSSAKVGDVLNDTATLTGGTNPIGTITFKLFPPTEPTCGGNPVYTSVVAVNGNATYNSTAGVPITGSNVVTTTGIYNWIADYSGDNNNSPSSSGCSLEPVVCTADQPCPAGSFTFHIETNGDLTIVYDQFPAPNDNSYGVNAVGWPGGHTFGNLTGSDKAGFQIKNPSGTVVLSFNIDYLTAQTGTPSGYASKGPFGGDGSVVVGPLTAADLTWDTSLARNLNGFVGPNNSANGSLLGGAGFCTALGCTVGGVNLLVDSPPTGDTVSDYTLTNPAHTGWDFHDTYYVTLKKAKLQTIGFLDAGGNQVPGWTVEPNLTVLHNSPAKPCPCVNGTAPTVRVDPDGSDGVWLTYQQSYNLNDNTYGTNMVGWGSKSHSFSSLTGSDKAEILIKNKNTGTTVFDGFFDYVSAKTGTPSGYDTLGVTGGDGSLSTGNAAWILPDSTTSFAQDLNTHGFFSGGSQVVGSGQANLLVNSPPTTGSTSYAFPVGSQFDESVAGTTAWDFNNTYYIHISAAAFGGSYSPANFDVSVPFLHNSPAKVCASSNIQAPPASPSFSQLPPPPSPAPFNVTAGPVTTKDRDLKVTLTNNGSNATISKITLTWPTADGKLQQVVFGGKTIFDTDVSPISATITIFKGTVADRTINGGVSKQFKFHFQSNIVAPPSTYNISVEFDGLPGHTVPILP